MLTLAANSIFTNTALTDDRDVWWEGMSEPPAHCTDWRGEDWTPEKGTSAAHPNARFTAPASQDPAIAPEWEDPDGVPISAILFGGRRASVVPLVLQSFDWDHGVFLGSIMASETTAAAAGAVGNLRRDPFAMLPFCGYNMADYFAHWLKIGASTDADKLPKIFYVNWFRKAEDGHWLWPGYGENSRVLEWVFDRAGGRGEAVETPVGWVPAPGAIDIEGVDVSKEDMEELLRVDHDEWRTEVPLIRKHYAQFGDRLPQYLRQTVDKLEQRLG
jgi:phosphoenolpyruvate carboxykinase (GTP)